MRYLIAAMILAAACVAGCVSVDLGQASKDWANVAKSYSNAFKGTPGPGTARPVVTPPTPQPGTVSP